MCLGLFGFKTDSYTIKKRILWAEINNGRDFTYNFAHTLQEYGYCLTQRSPTGGLQTIGGP